jgi:hypothetical protein
VSTTCCVNIREMPNACLFCVYGLSIIMLLKTAAVLVCIWREYSIHSNCKLGGGRCIDARYSRHATTTCGPIALSHTTTLTPRFGCSIMLDKDG